MKTYYIRGMHEPMVIKFLRVSMMRYRSNDNPNICPFKSRHFDLCLLIINFLEGM
jgi:hypothetical protein